MLKGKGAGSVDGTRNLSNNLQGIRKLRGLSQVGFAQELGIARSTLHDIEKGRSPNLETVDFISQRLGIPAGALISEDLSATEVDVLCHLLRDLDWYNRWSAEDQQAFSRLCREILALVCKYT